MIGRALKNVRSAVTKAAKPAPRKPAGPRPVGGVGTTGFKSGKGGVNSNMLKGGPTGPRPVGNVETNYRGIPGLVNATAPVPARGGFGAGFGGGAGMAKAPPMAKALPTVKKISSLANSVGRSMMKKGGAVKKATAKKRMV